MTPTWDIIDWHAHVYTPEEAAAPEWQGRSPLTIERLLDAHEAAGVRRSVVSNPIHYIKNRDIRQGLDALKRWHDYGARLQQEHGDRVVVIASAVPGGGPEYLAEIERAVDELGMPGVFINSSHQGHYPDEDAADPFFSFVTERAIPVMIHAPASSFGEDCMNMYRLISSVGRPMDECLALARLIVRGIFERYPDLTIVGAHVGGGICEVIGRMDFAYELQDEAFFLGSYEPMLIKKKPSEYLKNVYFDTANYHLPAIDCGLQTVGADHLVFGSDAPPLIPLLPRMQVLVEALPVSDEDKRVIFSGNAERLLGLTSTARSS